MPYKTKIFIIILLAGLSVPTGARTISRWHRLPRHGPPVVIRHPLERSDLAGDLLHFRYESEPVKPLMRVIRRGFVELYPEEPPEEGEVDISRSTQLLEELENEAEEALERGYDHLDLESEAAFSIFDPGSTQNASESLALPEEPELPTATVTLTLTGE
ncbi:MAG TPA: hypothetical protein DCG57_17515 [Candidatus Riflebacteria bacterium]|jgi:hypothetical protein|nr:hypothetical protein [Candidatus Riflebacteria bacterium]